MIVNPTPTPFTPSQVSTMQQYPTATTGIAQAPPQSGLTPAQQAIVARLQTGMSGATAQPQAQQVAPAPAVQGQTDLAGFPIASSVDASNGLTMPQMAIANMMNPGQPGSGYIGRGTGAPQPSPIAYGNRAPGPAPNVSYPGLIGRSPGNMTR